MVTAVRLQPRFSLQWWLSISLSTVMFGSLALFVGHVLRGQEGASLFLWVAAAALLGDLIVALIYEAMTPTRVVIGPGDRLARHDPLHEPAVTIDGFEQSPLGRVRVRGEVWLARYVSVQVEGPRRGEQVRVVAREGLLLVVTRDVRSGERGGSAGSGQVADP